MATTIDELIAEAERETEELYKNVASLGVRKRTTEEENSERNKEIDAICESLRRAHDAIICLIVYRNDPIEFSLALSKINEIPEEDMHEVLHYARLHIYEIEKMKK